MFTKASKLHLLRMAFLSTPQPGSRTAYCQYAMKLELVFHFEDARKLYEQELSTVPIDSFLWLEKKDTGYWVHSLDSNSHLVFDLEGKELPFFGVCSTEQQEAFTRACEVLFWRNEQLEKNKKEN